MEKQGINIDIKEKIELYVLGELDETDNKEILDSINENKELKAYYNQIRGIIKSEEYTRINKKFNEDNSLERVKKRMLLSQEETRINYRLLFKIAASLLVFSILSSLMYYFLYIQDGKHLDESLCIIEAPLGAKTKIKLPDKTEVVLNAGSTIKYNADFNQSDIRKVELFGEAFFEVAKNEKIPFVVKVDDLYIKALGTSFNVKAYEEEEAIVATLVEGLIQISKEGQENNAILLKPRQKASIYKNIDKTNIEDITISNSEKEKPLVKVNKIRGKDVFVQKNINTDLSTSWKDEKWVIQKMSFGELAVLLERKYNVKFEFGSPEINKFEFSGSFTNETLELVLKALQLAAPIKYEIDNDKVEITIDQKISKDYRRFLKKE